MPQTLTASRVVTPQGVRPATVEWAECRIVSVTDPIEQPLEIALLPGLIDTHVHVNEPGRTEWEGFATATRAAAAGGITTIVDMPLNSIPATTDVAALEQKRRAAESQLWTDVGFWGGVVGENANELVALAEAGVLGFKAFLIDAGVPEFTWADAAALRRAMPLLAHAGLPLLAHAELAEPIERVAGLPGDWRSYSRYLASRPDEAETAAVSLLIGLSREYRCAVHIVHVSSAQVLPLLRAARAEGLPITAETCPHYLFFTAEEVPDGATLYKCAPPIRDRENREALWQGLRDGVLDLIASDHSPCPPERKRLDTGRFDEAWGGIASLAFSLPAVWTEASQRGFGLDDVVHWMSERPAVLAGLEGSKGRIQVGYDADLTVFDADAEFVAGTEHIHARHPYTPYLGRKLRGRVVRTILRGADVYNNGKFLDPMGRERVRQ